jgi:hypothetical protein
MTRKERRSPFDKKEKARAFDMKGKEQPFDWREKSDPSVGTRPPLLSSCKLGAAEGSRKRLTIDRHFSIRMARK